MRDEIPPVRPKYALIKQLPHVNSTPEVDGSPSLYFVCHVVIRNQRTSVLEPAYHLIAVFFVKISIVG